jgi:[ribosomal protein S5]-alanine N-acetyltransferase
VVGVSAAQRVVICGAAGTQHLGFGISHLLPPRESFTRTVQRGRYTEGPGGGRCAPGVGAEGEGGRVQFPERIETARLVLRRPLPEDAEAVFHGWASDFVATRFMSWERHRSIEDARAFLEFSDAEWERWPAGPYLIELRSKAVPIGSCGFAFSAPDAAEVGYILAPDAWGLGYATESVTALVDVVANVGSITLCATVHPENTGSLHVLEKCGFDCGAQGCRRPSRTCSMAVRPPRFAACG